jgi:hypothetical protein
MYPVLKYALENGEKTEILTKHPEIYEALRARGLIISDRYAKEPDRECRYAPRYANQATTTYKDTLILAGIADNLPLEIEFECQRRFDFPVGKKVCVIRKPSIPMKGKPGGEVMIPDCNIFKQIIHAFRNEVYFVLAGNSEGDFKFQFKGIDLDLTEKLTVTELLQLIKQSDIALTQCGFFLPFCEALNKKVFIVFADKGMKSKYKFFPHITPKKVINKPNLVGWSIDSEGPGVAIDSFARMLVREGKCLSTVR